ncbi:bifunctional protein GlmU [Nakamurella endophytica]|uniref:Bifunctional protein GlmU n=1 Tax=Nakamurella endophytica TaxID=1748367 RepID=A0A917SLV9_9ACTN|nr:bifunctional protein GlmU [Nakamurella endophytica]
MPDDPSTAGSPTRTPAIAAVVVLAAGAGTRMRSELPKVLHPIAGRPLLWHALTAAGALGPRELVAVVGHGREQVAAYLDAHHPEVRQAVQDRQLGTGHAVAAALGDTVPDGVVLVTYGDVPLLTPETLRLLVDAHAEQHNAVTVLTARVPDPSGYGRIVRDAGGGVRAIVEHRDADESQRAIDEINSGVYAFDGAVLAGALPRLTAGNAAGERYLTDVVSVAVDDGRRVGAVIAPDPTETEGVNDRVQLAALARRLNDRLVRQAQLAGVTVLDPATTWLHADVRLEPDTTLLPGTSLEAGTTVATGATVGPDSTLSACRVGEGATVTRSHCIEAEIGPGATVGPWTYLRPGSVLGADSKVGAFVEVKKSTVGAGAKVPHLSYVGDAEIGPGSNIGAGVITANYDGVAKHRTVVGSEAFVGTDSTLVAPVTIGDGAYVAAGSTVTDDVAAGDLGIARGRQAGIPGWVLRKRAGTAADRAARRAGATDDPPGEHRDTADRPDSAEGACS